MMSVRSNNLIWYGVGAAALLLFISGNAMAASSVSQSQLQQTANLESFSPQAYPDGSNGNTQLYSIGYGHQIGPNESYLLSATITQAQAMALLQNDLAPIISALNNSGVQFTPGQFDALVDFGYNEGVGAMNKIVATLSGSGSDAATSEMQLYIYWHPVPGGPAVVSQDLVNRRNLEIDTFNS